MAKGSKDKLKKKKKLEEREIVKKLKKQVDCKLIYNSRIKSCEFEFYFSDANLQKDKFLRKMIDEDENGYVDVAIFKKFNKVKALTDNFSLVIKAIKMLDGLEMSEDGERIRRRTTIPAAECIDERTIYVEVIPKRVDHEWVRKHFDKFGEILYVSIPKYKSTGDNKGFAFVEYKDPENAQKACRAYIENSTFNDSELENNSGQESGNVDHLVKKRKLSDEDVKKAIQSIEKKPKVDKGEEKTVYSEVKSDYNNSEMDKSNQTVGKNRKDSDKKIDETKDSKAASQRKPNATNQPFKVISKLKWLEYKMQYKEQQKERMRNIKQDFNRESDVAEQPINRNKSNISYQPGVILCVNSSSDDGLQKKVIKSMIPDAVKVQYIDIIDGNSTGYIRLASEDDTSKLLEKFKDTNLSESNSEINLNIKWHKLEGVEEEKYWEKIIEDKKHRTHKQSIRKNKKGSEKILDKAEKRVSKTSSSHIFFPDS
ncbi:uncharacterized protein TRIADDRAFT_54426 [Trichoplax adhaerens]|uniref:La-related protein 7 n=1 Tax=Trichoplax adhaerens TaxID=10228 RepID=B3RS01_TRIAD|nr:hypothetical protein TRIADDRAFT_54426 [Trichoplax adhaerens]EDV26437.1 hypothetical protein TRIADDRAFT_54426 [Trichoplax adhaerens]|eukprot:XP_002110433.1 hypothetical protein TRIADDRAFT_54426 [Trichoplax adhaerens]